MDNAQLAGVYCQVYMTRGAEKKMKRNKEIKLRVCKRVTGTRTNSTFL